MIERLLLKDLEKWSKKKDRKPLIIRGARQVGKTTLVNEFGKKFKQYIPLNIELPIHKELFEKNNSIETLLEAIFFLSNKSISNRKDTLIFIDEIQESPNAIKMLRYFYESASDIHVIAAGSMLESIFDTDISFPVGRVEYKILRPLSFPEYLSAMGETEALNQIENIPIPDFAHDKLLSLFHNYALIGGMPEVVKNYRDNRDLTLLREIFDSLITSYIEDIEKYASSENEVIYLRHAIRSSFAEAGRRIKFVGFGNSAYTSRDMSEALKTLEKALLLQLIYPVTSTKLPVTPVIRKSPRLQVLDTGMMNFFAGIQKEFIGVADLDTVYKGISIEHLVGQEMLSFQTGTLSSLKFWVREKSTSNAEVDFVYQFDSNLIPVEVKSGSSGKLRSLNLYMDQAPHDLALRFYSGTFGITKTKTLEGKKFKLLNIPYYLVTKIDKYIEYGMKK